jgi:predicted short-subunit dehydrogenase-like oxidoreductase (DUF2520 family)
MQIVIIGTGNVATVLGMQLKNAGHTIVQVFGRNKTAAATLADKLNASAASAWPAIQRGAAVYLVAISDNALYTLPDVFTLHNELVVHTAGAVSIEVLKPVSRHYGVLYPLQSLRSNKPVVSSVPLMIDANSSEQLEILQQLAASISDKVMVTNDEQRLKMHLAAVIVNNFVNHMYRAAANWCQQQQLDFSALLPLIQETAARIQNAAPVDMQTGPAIRKDTATIEKHLQLLNGEPALKSLYQFMTQQIMAADER